MGAMQRRKGARLEREAAELLRPAFPNVSRRAAGEESQERRGVDLKGTGHLVVQVTGGARPALLRKFREVVAAIPAGRYLDQPRPVALVLAKTDRGEWLATLRARDLVELLNKVPNPPE